MKEPKDSKFEAINQKYKYFEEDIFYDKENNKNFKNAKSQYIKNPFLNTSYKFNFFSSLEKKEKSSSEEIYRIISPTPSPSNRSEAEEVEVFEEDSDEDININQFNEIKGSNEKNKNFEDIREFSNLDSELKSEEEKQSKIMIKNEGKKRKKENKDKRRKEGEENKKKEVEEKKYKLRQERRKMKVNEEKKESKFGKKKKEDEKIEKKKKNNKEEKKDIKTLKKNDLSLMSIINKKSYDNINGPSTSLINDIKIIFPEVIHEENADEENDQLLKDFNRKKVKRKYSESSTEKKNKQERKKSKFKSKKIAYNEEQLSKDKSQINIKAQCKILEDKNDKNEKINKNGKIIPLSTKSKDLGNEDKNKKKKKKPSKIKSKKNNKPASNKENQETFNNAFDPNNWDSDFGIPKKRKIIIRDKHKSKPKKIISSKQKYPTQKIDLRSIYSTKENIKLYNFIPQKKEETTFGLNGRYSLRTRVKTLNHELGEKIHYVDHGEGPEIKFLEIAINPKFGDSYIYNMPKNKESENEAKRRKKISSKKEGKIFQEDNIENSENYNKEEYNRDSLNSQIYSDYEEEDGERIIKIPKGKKKIYKNKEAKLIIQVKEAKGENMIIVDTKAYKNLNNGDTVKVTKNQEYEILNFSRNDLILKLL